MAGLNEMYASAPRMTAEELERLYESYHEALQHARLSDLHRVRKDLLTWRRGSAELVLKVNPTLGNVSIYSVLVTGAKPSLELYRHLLSYNTLQRRESLGMYEQDQRLYIVLKYTMELELATAPVVQRHVFALQEIADDLDSELATKFGGDLHFEDWNRLDQGAVDNLLSNLFG